MGQSRGVNAHPTSPPTKNWLLLSLPHLSLSPLTLDFVTFIHLPLKNPYYICMYSLQNLFTCFIF